MPIDSKECFAALTEDGQLWEIYQAAQTGGGGITSINGDTTAAQLISGTAPITASTAAGTTTISTSMNTARLLGRTTAGVGVAEEITVGTGLSLAGGTLTNTVTAGVTSVTATAPLTSSGGATPDISTSISTNRIVGRSTAGTGVMEQLTPVGITVSAGNITGIGGTTGTVDNAVPRADGTGGYTVQGSDIVIDDATTSTQNNVAITNQHSGQTNSSLVLTPKGTGALIAGPKPDGTATGGNARGANAVDFQTSRTAATQVASGANSAIVAGTNNTAACIRGFVGAGSSNNNAIGSSNNHANNAILVGSSNSINSFYGVTNSAIVAGSSNNIFTTLSASAGSDNAILAGNGNALNLGSYSAIIAGQLHTSTAAGGIMGAGYQNSNKNFYTALMSGVQNEVDGYAGFIGAGYGNKIGAQSAAILGGEYALANRWSMQAHAAGRFSADGDAQRARFVLRCKTTTNAAVEMALNGSTTYLGIPSGKVIACTINISGVKSDGSAVAHYVRQYAVKNVGGTSSEVYAPVTIGTDNAAGTTIALSANNTDDTLRIAVTGIAAETWRWVASVDAVEIAYGT